MIVQQAVCFLSIQHFLSINMIKRSRVPKLQTLAVGSFPLDIIINIVV